MAMTPSGEQFEIRHGQQTAVVVQVGGGLRSYDVAGQAVVDGFAADARPDGGRGQVLAPWPNRIRDGRYAWDGEHQQLALSEAKAHNAIHGLVRWAEWSLVERSETSVSVGVRVWPQPGYPFRLDVTARYSLDDAGLMVTLVGRNAGDVPLPYGIGQHPYVTVGTARVDDAVLTIPADRWLRSDDHGVPTEVIDVQGTEYDFRQPRPIGALRLDTAYAGVARTGDERAVVRLASADEARSVDVWLGRGADYLQVYTGDTLSADHRRRGLAVEPMSCPPDAFNSGTGLVTLEPETSHTMTWGLSAR